MPTIHVLAPHHTILNDDHSHCAFTGKARRMAQMMKPFGYTIHEYSNAGSESAADAKHVMLNEAEYKMFFKPETVSPGAQSATNTAAFGLFQQRLERGLREYAKPGDIVAHIWTAYWGMVERFPRLIHVETGIGYPNDGIGAYRIFESYAWMHHHWARYATPGGVIPTVKDGVYQIDRNPACTWVVPNYYDPADWPFQAEPENNVVFMARFVVDKGIEMLRKVIKRWHELHPDDGLKFVLAGMGEYARWLANSNFTSDEIARIDYRGVVNGPDRAKMCGNAKAMLLPSIFIEPFGGSGVESMMCFPGTTVVRSPRIERTYRRKYAGRLLQICAGDALVECTPEHPFLTQRGWTPASCLHVGDKVARSASYGWRESIHSGRIEDLVDALPELRHPYHGQETRPIVRVCEVEGTEDGPVENQSQELDRTRYRCRGEALPSSRLDPGRPDARAFTGQRDAEGGPLGGWVLPLSTIHDEGQGDRQTPLLAARREASREDVGSYARGDSGVRASNRVATSDQAQNAHAQGYAVAGRTVISGGLDRWRGHRDPQAISRTSQVSSTTRTSGQHSEYCLGDDGMAARQDSNTKCGAPAIQAGEASSSVALQLQGVRASSSVSSTDSVLDGEATSDGDAGGAGRAASDAVQIIGADRSRGGAGPHDPLYEWATVTAVSQREVEDLPVFNLGTSTGTYEANGFLVHNCGTPLLGPDFGAFTETIEEGVSGVRCRTVDDYVHGIEWCLGLDGADRKYVSDRARHLYSLDACGRKYHDIFTRLTTTASVE